jgi:hypothetical protein
MPHVRRVAALAVCAILLFPPPPGAAQIIGTSTPVADFAPVDAVALGVARASSLGVFAADYQAVVGAGAGLAGGAVRAFAGAATDIWSVGAGYARTMLARRLTETTRESAGLQLVVGYRHDDYLPHSFGALRLTAPLAITFGDPNQPSSDARTFAIYAAPYADIGVIEQLNPNACFGSVNCSTYHHASAHSAGVGAGSRMSFGQFALELMARDVVSGNFRPNVEYVTFGASLRL